MNILLYNPDNGVTRNFMPHLWMFLLKSLTPAGHTVFLIDGNAQPLGDDELAGFVRKNRIGLAGIGMMTRMAVRAYSAADAMRGAGAKVVFGGPHVTEVPGEPLGQTGEPRHADAVALGEADATWPEIVRDAARGELRERYEPVDASGREVKPGLDDYPVIPWEDIDLDQFNLIRNIPGPARSLLNTLGMTWQSLYVIPIESGRGCPYGCDFCTVTGFFGDAIRFRTNDSVVSELLRLKARERRDKGRIAVFFIDDNFAINVKRTKALLREIIRRDAILPWVAQISANLLKDEELLDLIQASGGRWIFIGMESVDPHSLAGVNKSFNKPADYGSVLDRLSSRGIYAITSFIFGMDGDTRGVAGRTVDEIEAWPPGLPVYGLLTPYPATPLYDRLKGEGRLTRPRHWLDFQPFRMAFTPNGLSIPEAEAEVRQAWRYSYSPRAIAMSLRKIRHRPFHERAIMFSAKLAFRGIYFPQMRKSQWAVLLVRNAPTMMRLVWEGCLLAWRRPIPPKRTAGVADREERPSQAVAVSSEAEESSVAR